MAEATFWVDYENLKKLEADLKAIDKELPKQLQRGNKRAAVLIAEGAKGEIHSVTGALAKSIRPRATRTNAKVIYNYGGRLPYGTVQEYGGGVLWYAGGGGKARSALYSLSSGHMTYKRFAAGGAQGLERGAAEYVPTHSGGGAKWSVNPIFIKARKRTQYGGYYLGESARKNLKEAFNIIRNNCLDLMHRYLGA